MLEISVLVLALQIGFNVALNYRGYNYNPLIPASHFMNYAPTRRLFNPHRYFPFASRRIPASDSDQSESEDLSFEETSFRLNSEHNRPYLRQKNRHRYNNVADNDASLEQLPVGRMGLNNYADLYRSAQTDRNRENFRMPNRRAPNNKFYRKADNDLSLESLPDDNKYFKYREDLLKLNQLAKRLKQRQEIKSSKLQTKDNNDVSLENGPKDNFDPEDDSVNNLPALDAVSNIETSENRRVSFKKTVDRLAQADRNQEDFRRPFLRNRVPNRRAPNNKFHSRKDDNDLSLLEILTDDSKYPKTLEEFLKLNHLIKEAQVINSKHHNKDNNDVSLENETKDNINPDENSVHNPPALDAVSNVEKSQNRRGRFQNSVDSSWSPHEDTRNFNLRKFSNLESPNNRRNRKDSAKLLNNKHLKMPSSNKDIPDAYMDTALPISDDSKPADITDARPQLRNSNVRNLDKNTNNYRKMFNRSDDDDDDLETILNDRLSAPDDIDNKSVLGLANEDDFNFDLPELRQNNIRRTYDEVSFALSPNDRSNQGDDEAIENLPDLFVDSFDDLSLVPSGLRSNVLLDLQNNRKENNAADLELPLNDNLSAEEDNLSNLAILRLLSPDDLSLETSLLRRRESVKQNKNHFSRRDNDELGLELLLTDKLSPDDHGVENLVPYHETHLRSSEPTHISLFEKPSNDDRIDTEDLHVESSLNNKLNNDDYSASDLSVLRSSSLDNVNLEPERLRTREPLYLLNKPNTRRHEVRQRDPLYDAVDLFGLNKLENSEVSSLNLRQGENEATGNDSLLQLEYPWNGKMAPDDENIIISPLGSNEKLVARQNQNLNESNYDLKLEYPWNDQLSPDKDTTTKVPALRSEKSKHNFESPNLRNRNNKKNRRSSYDPSLHMQPLTRRLHNEDASLLDHFNDNEFNDRNILRYSDKTFDEARRTTEDDTEVTNSLEDPSGYITFPVDRRPNPRLRSRNNNVKKPRYGNRRANAPLATTTMRPEATEALLTAEVTTEKPTDIDTVVI